MGRMTSAFIYVHPRPISFFYFILSILSIVSLVFPVSVHAESDGLERDLQRDFSRSTVIVEAIQSKLAQGISASSEITQLKSIAENIRITSLLIEERFRLREEKVKALGAKAQERHQAMAEGYKAALAEYLSLIDSLSMESRQGQVASSQEKIINDLKTLLDRLLPKKKRPIIGSLPYKHPNYPAQEPVTTPAIMPASKGGNKTISPADTASTQTVPISKTIAELAQSLNWQPVAIYEYVKDNIETEWYWGCMKGAEETLRQKSGNDCDQAALFAALLRASGFPARIVRGNIEFFAGGVKGDPMQRAKNLTGIDDPAKIAEFFQKAGIPYKPIIAGGKIANYEISHIWVESLIPMANYRGAIIDEHGKTWLGLDTSIKTKDYVYNNARDLFELSAIGDRLSGIRDEYLSAVQTLTPLEYLKEKLTTADYRLSDLMLSRTLPPHNMKILPYGMQFVEKTITGEYTDIPDELKHKVRFRASRQNTADSTQGDLFDITIPLYRLSNQPIAIGYEPESVEDQEIINSYGGLDNTPSYLVHLRPVLKINGERIVVAKDGLPMGADYTLTMELYTPSANGGTAPAETITNTMITGNLSVIGITAQKVAMTPSPLAGEGGGEGAKDAERLLYEETQHYIDRWNKAEDELASLLHLSIARPLPAVVTVSGVIDVTYLLDTPHGFTWKGLFIDADMRAIEIILPSPPFDKGGVGGFSADRQKLFMQLSSLQGSILENRIFEDDFQVESISTAKLFQYSQESGVGSQIVVINKTNIDAILPTLPFDDNIKEDITNTVNQNLVVRIPQSEITYKDWTGIGYIKENIETGESGWMLSGSIAGGQTALTLEKWVNQYLKDTLSTPYKGIPNSNPLLAARIIKITPTDRQIGTVGTQLKEPLAVLVQDSKGIPVKGAVVTFKVIAGGGKFLVNGQQTDTAVVTTAWTGIAKAKFILGKHTQDNPAFMKINANDLHYTQIGENIVTASVKSLWGDLSLPAPFEAYGKPGDAVKIIETYGDSDELNNKYVYSSPNTFSGTITVKVADQYDNPVSNKKVTFTVQPQVFLGTPPTGEAKNAKVYGNVEDCPGVATLECSNTYPKTLPDGTTRQMGKYTDSSGASAYVILGNTDYTKYTITASAKKDLNGAETTTNIAPPGEFHHYSFAVNRSGSKMTDPFLSVTSVYTVDEKGNLIDAGFPGMTFARPLTAAMFYTEEDHTVASCGASCYYLKGKGTFTTKPVDKGKVDYTVLQGGGSVNPATKTEGTNGQYSTTLTLGGAPIMNVVKATGTATVQVPVLNTSTGEETRTAKQLSDITAFEVWGVRATIDPNQLIIINKDGYPIKDTPIKYKIEPAEYTPQTIYLYLYEQDAYKAFIGGSKTEAILRAEPLKFNPELPYSAVLMLNAGSVISIWSDKTPVNIVYFGIVKPAANEPIVIKNDSNGDPNMQPLTAQVELKGTGISPTAINTQDVYWKFKVEYVVSTNFDAQHRARKGLDSSGAGQGTDGYKIPLPNPDIPNSDWAKKVGATFVISDADNSDQKWDKNFGGGKLEIIAKTTIKGIEVIDTYIGKIEGEAFSDAFKTKLTAYLENPKADETTPTIRTEVGYDKFFRVIAYIETRYRHFYPSIYGDPKNAMYPRENKKGDGGFGVMQLTDDASLPLNNLPSYEQIWDWKKNVDGGVEVLRGKLAEAKAYPESVRTTGCTTLPQGDTYFCKPSQKKDKKATDFSAYELKMDTYSLYNSGWHYWKWVVVDKKRGIKKWQPRISKGKACGDVPNGSCYADEAEEIEKNPPSDF